MFTVWVDRKRRLQYRVGEHFTETGGYRLGVDRLSVPILSILPIIDIGRFQNRFADNIIIIIIIFLCKQTYYLQVTLFIGE